MIKDDKGSQTLITDPQEIQQLAPLQYSDLQKSRQHGFDNLPDEWRNIYKPMLNLDEDIYKGIMDLPDMDEWITTLKQYNDKSALGSSNIGYKLLKKAGKKAYEVFIKFAGILFDTATFPKEWITSQIFPISKSKSWQYQLNNTHPILLLECLRKAIVKVLTTRLGNVLNTNNILQEPNFAGLPGSSTDTPIHIINNIIEDAHE
jgi:hypothetical protein